MSRVLVLRDPAAARETCEALRASGHEPVLLPLQEIEILAAPPPDGPFAGVLLTSRNAVPAIDARLSDRELPVLAVGRATARHAAQAGFTVIHVGEGSAASLVEPASRLSKERGLPLLLALGRVRRPELEADLAAAGVAFRLWETYDTHARLPSADEAARLLGGALAPDAVLLLSGGQAEGFAALLAREPGLLRPLPRILCLSARIAAALPVELRPFASILPGGDASKLFGALA